ncbi:MAG TPA: thiolase family protein [Woeseiaceae bacterium]|nr:thiolase family protein [Woeseiaceae bacterium]
MAGRSNYVGIAVAQPYTEPYVRRSNAAAPWFLGRALAGVLRDSGLGKDAIDGLAVTSMSLAPDTVPAVVEHFGLSPRWLESVPYGGASGVIALQRAARAVQCGDAEVVACIAGDTMGPGLFAAQASRFSSFSMEGVWPYGAGGPNAVFALITAAYMERFGVGREDFGRFCIEQRENGSANPLALLREPLTLEDYLAARPIVEPLHLFDCVMPCAGGEGFLVLREDRAAALGLRYARIRGIIERHNAFPDDAVQLRGGWARDRDALYEQAGAAPGDMDFIETYDDYPVISFMQLEDLGFCEKGGAAEFVRTNSGVVGRGGLPHNTSGGQLSSGQAGFAGGYLGLVEALRQLSGKSIGRQVPDASLGLVSGFGYVNYDRGLCTSAAILERADA